MHSYVVNCHRNPSRRRPSCRLSAAIHSGAPSGRPIVGARSIRAVVAGSAGAVRSAAKPGISARNGATVASSSSSPARWARALDHGQSSARLTSAAPPGWARCNALPPAGAARPSPSRRSGPGIDAPSIGTECAGTGVTAVRFGEGSPQPIAVDRRHDQVDMVERAAAGETPSGPQPPQAGTRRARLYGVSPAAENQNRQTMPAGRCAKMTTGSPLALRVARAQGPVATLTPAAVKQPCQPWSMTTCRSQSTAVG